MDIRFEIYFKTQYLQLLPPHLPNHMLGAMSSHHLSPLHGRFKRWAVPEIDTNGSPLRPSCTLPDHHHHPNHISSSSSPLLVDALSYTLHLPHTDILFQAIDHQRGDQHKLALSPLLVHQMCQNHEPVLMDYRFSDGCFFNRMRSGFTPT